ncbi:hypothetical protein H5410_047426 [Solanum commersonii]|uniref:Uncharacterized protein n=1 Tax=Solanum commersonii TaxID=4109 RepID=A0A9J5XJ43_SOLCO|nr:hypothetical protein H5410_047426 [Solanum commersonii]
MPPEKYIRGHLLGVILRSKRYPMHPRCNLERGSEERARQEVAILEDQCSLRMNPPSFSSNIIEDLENFMEEEEEYLVLCVFLILSELNWLPPHIK